jgi:superfamily II DNA or RNA helicase
MSFLININKLSEEQKVIIDKELVITMSDNSKYRPGNNTRYIYPYRISNEVISIPFCYAYTRLRFNRPKRNTFTKTNVTFVGSLRPEQKQVKKEAIRALNKTGSVIISAYTGFGKCLGKNTPILMFDGTLKMVQDIVVGDELMGDDSTRRDVYSICSGTEQMYKIVQSSGESFVANESHILSLKFDDGNSISYEDLSQHFSHDNNAFDVIDISIRNFLKLPSYIRRKFKCYKSCLTFPRRDVIIHPYKLGKMLAKRHYSIESNFTTQQSNLISHISQTHSIPSQYKLNSSDIRFKLLFGFIYKSTSIYNTRKDSCEVFTYYYEIASDMCYLARSLGMFASFKCLSSTYEDIRYSITIDGMENAKKNMFTKSLKFSFDIIPVREITYYGFTIGGNRRFMLGDFTVTHNTAGAINLSRDIGFKTLVIVNKIILMKQWEHSISKFCPDCSILKVNMKDKPSISLESDFSIINAINIPKLDPCVFSDIGLVIVDEAHLIMAETLSRCLQYIQPRYLIGLTATPYRVDGLNVLLDFYFGSTKIIRKLWRSHTVYKVETGFVPTIELNKNGKVNWNTVLDSQAICESRNELIINIIRYFSSRTFLVLTKRISQGEYLYNHLKELGENVTSLLGKQQDFDIDSRILIGTNSKIGTGFDHPRLDTLLLAADVQEYFIQYLGRCMRTQEVNPVIFDLCDKNKILNRHFSTRRAIYLEHGGIIKDFDISYPEFKICKV